MGQLEKESSRRRDVIIADAPLRALPVTPLTRLAELVRKLPQCHASVAALQLVEKLVAEEAGQEKESMIEQERTKRTNQRVVSLLNQPQIPQHLRRDTFEAKKPGGAFANTLNPTSEPSAVRKTPLLRTQHPDRHFCSPPHYMMVDMKTSLDSELRNSFDPLSSKNTPVNTRCIGDNNTISFKKGSVVPTILRDWYKQNRELIELAKRSALSSDLPHVAPPSIPKDLWNGMWLPHDARESPGRTNYEAWGALQPSYLYPDLAPIPTPHFLMDEASLIWGPSGQATADSHPAGPPPQRLLIEPAGKARADSGLTNPQPVARPEGPLSSPLSTASSEEGEGKRFQKFMAKILARRSPRDHGMRDAYMTGEDDGGAREPLVPENSPASSDGQQPLPGNEAHRGQGCHILDREGPRCVEGGSEGEDDAAPAEARESRLKILAVRRTAKMESRRRAGTMRSKANAKGQKAEDDAETVPCRRVGDSKRVSWDDAVGNLSRKL